MKRFTLDAVHIKCFRVKLLLVQCCPADVGRVFKVPLEALLCKISAGDWVIDLLFIKGHSCVGVCHTAWDNVFTMACGENKCVFLAARYKWQRGVYR